jgi:ureidoglycolate hydrolase
MFTINPELCGPGIRRYPKALYSFTQMLRWVDAERGILHNPWVALHEDGDYWVVDYNAPADESLREAEARADRSR